MKSFFSHSAVFVSALFISSLLISAQPSLAENLLAKFQKQSVPPQNQPAVSADAASSPTNQDGKGNSLAAEKATLAIPSNPIAPKAVTPSGEAVHYVATAYSLRGRTASGRYVSQGIIAADPRVLPLGSRVRLEAGPWSGEYLVADTGGRIRGRKIDIWTPTSREAMRFGRRKVKLTVLSYPAKRVLKKRV